MKMGIALVLVGVAIAIALVISAGSRLSNEAMAVVIGALCGISASIPVSIGLIIASRGQVSGSPRDAMSYAQEYNGGQGVVVITRENVMRLARTQYVNVRMPQTTAFHLLEENPVVINSVPCEHGVDAGMSCPICSRNA